MHYFHQNKRKRIKKYLLENLFLIYLINKKEIKLTIPSSLSCRGGVGGFVEFVVGATVGKGNGVVYLAIAKDTGGLKNHILQNPI